MKITKLKDSTSSSNYTITSIEYLIHAEKPVFITKLPYQL